MECRTWNNKKYAHIEQQTYTNSNHRLKLLGQDMPHQPKIKINNFRIRSLRVQYRNEWKMAPGESCLKHLDASQHQLPLWIRIGLTHWIIWSLLLEFAQIFTYSYILVLWTKQITSIYKDIERNNSLSRSRLFLSSHSYLFIFAKLIKEIQNSTWTILNRSCTYWNLVKHVISQHLLWTCPNLKIKKITKNISKMNASKITVHFNEFVHTEMDVLSYKKKRKKWFFDRQIIRFHKYTPREQHNKTQKGQYKGWGEFKNKK